MDDQGDKTQLYLNLMNGLDSRLSELFQEIRDVRTTIEHLPAVDEKIAQLQEDFENLNKLVVDVQEEFTVLEEKLKEPLTIYKIFKWFIAIVVTVLIGIWLQLVIVPQKDFTPPPLPNKVEETTKAEKTNT